jgi:hypothetical protein
VSPARRARSETPYDDVPAPKTLLAHRAARTVKPPSAHTGQYRFYDEGKGGRTGATTRDGDSCSIDFALLREVLDASDRIVDVDESPVALETLSELLAVPSRSTVVDVCQCFISRSSPNGTIGYETSAVEDGGQTHRRTRILGR